MQKKSSEFLKLPEYPGGKEEFIKFVKKHLNYPKEAIENKIEGLVIISAEITDMGDVLNIRVEKGIGYGCDQEAMRILNLMKFGSVKNRGLRVKSRKKFKLKFTLPKPKGREIIYNIKKETVLPPEKTPENYSYTIIIGNRN